MTVTFGHLLAAHYRRVHRAALGFLGEEQEAREAAQEALLKAYRARGRYDPARPFYPWLHRIVRNTCLDALARRRHRAVPGLEPERVAVRQPGADALAAQGQEHRRLYAALEQLQPDHREIIQLRHFEDLSYAEIGEILGLPKGTVMSRLFRARRALARLMQETP